jgi:hypothetical protein
MATCLAGVLAVLAGCASQPEKKTDYYARAESWLRLLDNEEIAQARDAMALKAKEGYSLEEFAQDILNYRGSLGKVKKRHFWQKRYASTMRGQPDGVYADVIFQSYYENKNSGAFEHVLLVKHAEAWQVTGYMLR